MKKAVLVSLVEFLCIRRTIWEDPIRLLDIACNIIVMFKTTCDGPPRGVGSGNIIALQRLHNFLLANA